MTSTVPSGAPGNALEQTAGVGDDHGLGHAEAADPAGLRLGERRFDDRRPHDGDRHIALHVGERLLAECLGERVGVGPADTGGTGTTGLDQLVLDPALAELLGLRCESGRPGRTELGPGVGAELHETGRLAAGGVAVRAQATAGGDLAAPVDADVERTVADEDLGCVAAPVAGDVAGGHGDEVGRDPEFVAQVGDARGAEQVDLDRGVERRVERHRGGGVDDGVARRPDGTVGVVQAEPVTGDVTGHDDHAAGDRSVEVRSVRRTQSIEGVVLEDFLAGPFGGTRALPVADQQHHFAIGDGAEQSFHERGADETGRTGDGDPFPRQRRSNHG